MRDAEPALYLYRQVMDGRQQVGIVGCVHVDDYEHDIIRKHEKTRKDKEDDRTRHVLTLNANAEPVFLAYRPSAGDRRRSWPPAAAATPLYDFTAPDGVRHIVWKVADPPTRWCARSPPCRWRTWPTGTTARRAPGGPGQERRAANPQHTGDEEYNWFLAVLFPSDAAARSCPTTGW